MSIADYIALSVVAVLVVCVLLDLVLPHPVAMYDEDEA